MLNSFFPSISLTRAGLVTNVSFSSLIDALVLEISQRHQHYLLKRKYILSLRRENHFRLSILKIWRSFLVDVFCFPRVRQKEKLCMRRHQISFYFLLYCLENKAHEQKANPYFLKL